ncbi:MAG: beta-glycosidase [Bacteroidales bacterium]|nr:beta-glycosidase [Bacteroidales bacterium]
MTTERDISATPTILVIALVLILSIGCQRTTSLSGTWELALDVEGTLSSDSPFDDNIRLPGTTDLAGKGNEPENTNETSRLTRRHSYVGKAWYRRMITIPLGWKNKEVALFLERTKASTVFLDGKEIGSSNDISTPQTFNLGKLKPGLHSLAIRVDNGGGVPEQVIKSSHMYSEDTQTNWNGIIGDISIATNHSRLLSLSKRRRSATGRLARLEIIDNQFVAGGHKVFLRGKHDACVFPLTGHTPMDQKSWLKYLGKCQEYGINHIRFHSWCPPEAAFEAADELGIYLQPELPFWGTLAGDELLDFLKKEGLNIVRTYGHHPSFALFSLGNELWGEPEVMRDLVETFRTEAPHILYTNGTNAYLGYHGYVDGMDFQATCRTGWESYEEYNNQVRSSFAFCDAMDGGILNHFYPGTRRNFSEALRLSPVPVISHETGQFQTYPDYSEIKKYTGPLVPYNLMEFRRRLEEAGMADQAEEFHKASGEWAARLYKADIEMCLRTPNLGGFQLLDLQDYPGQGSAYVGLLDAFMDSKGIVDREEWLGWCSEIVPLAEFDKYCWTSGERFKAGIKVADFSLEPIKEVTWTLAPDGAEPIAEGSMDCPAGEGLLDVGDIEVDLTSVIVPSQMCLTVTAKAGEKEIKEHRNSWPVWIYPSDNQPDKTGVFVTRRLDKEALATLDAGRKVLLMPSDTTGTVGGLFQTDYWNYRMFKNICENNGKPVSPGTLGILTDPEHPLFREFPTEGHTDWQWFPILKASRPEIIDSLEDVTPIVQVIDNIERNHKLALVYEKSVGKGKLLVCRADLESVQEYPEGRQFLKALLDYLR